MKLRWSERSVNDLISIQRYIALGNYRIVYRVGDGGVLILTIFEGHQLLRL
jgi:plasmid stabilization system protein ParE